MQSEHLDYRAVPMATLTHCHPFKWSIGEDQYFDSGNFKIKRICRLYLLLNSRVFGWQAHLKSLDLTPHFGGEWPLYQFFMLHIIRLLCLCVCARMHAHTHNGQRLITLQLALLGLDLARPAGQWALVICLSILPGSDPKPGVTNIQHFTPFYVCPGELNSGLLFVWQALYWWNYPPSHVICSFLVPQTYKHTPPFCVYICLTLILKFCRQQNTLFSFVLTCLKIKKKGLTTMKDFTQGERELSVVFKSIEFFLFLYWSFAFLPLFFVQKKKK